jgi:hypothetical protein
MPSPLQSADHSMIAATNFPENPKEHWKLAESGASPIAFHGCEPADGFQ